LPRRASDPSSFQSVIAHLNSPVVFRLSRLRGVAE
jgi:hypothetical protein